MDEKQTKIIGFIKISKTTFNISIYLVSIDISNIYIDCCHLVTVMLNFSLMFMLTRKVLYVKV